MDPQTIPKIALPHLACLQGMIIIQLLKKETMFSKIPGFTLHSHLKTKHHTQLLMHLTLLSS